MVSFTKWLPKARGNRSDPLLHGRILQRTCKCLSKIRADVRLRRIHDDMWQRGIIAQRDGALVGNIGQIREYRLRTLIVGVTKINMHKSDARPQQQTRLDVPDNGRARSTPRVQAAPSLQPETTFF